MGKDAFEVISEFVLCDTGSQVASIERHSRNRGEFMATVTTEAGDSFTIEVSNHPGKVVCVARTVTVQPA